MSTPEAGGAPSPRPPAGGARPGRGKQSVPVSVFLGIMAVPLAAAASMFIVKPHVDEPAARAATGAPESAAVATLDQDILAACGPIGLQMAELDSAGTLTALQSAALDALRPICAQQGMPLPEAAAQTAQAVLTASGGSPGTGSQSPSDDDWDDSHDSDDSDDWDDSHDSDDSDDWDDSDDSDDWDD